MQEAWFIIVVSLCISALVRAILSCISRSSRGVGTGDLLPPGPQSIPLIGNLIWLRQPLSELEFVLRRLKTRYGPIITMRIGRRPFIFIGSHSLAHRALVQKGANFSDRPVPPPTSKILNRNQKAISSAAYGPTWRLLRRNLTQEILHPARVKSHSGSRRWVLSILMTRLLSTTHSVRLMDHFQYAMFCLLVLMCFGDKLQESAIRDIEAVQRRILVGFRRFNSLNFWPQLLSKILLRKRWNELMQLRLDQERVLIPLIRGRTAINGNVKDRDHEEVACYVDTLVDLQLPEENRKLDEAEMVSLCSEFLSAGTDTTSTALQWIMANLVKYPHIQDKLYNQIRDVVGLPPPLPSSCSSGLANNNIHPAGGEDHEEAAAAFMKALAVVEEEDLQKMPYLKAVVLEALRRHPPGHFVLPHKVTRDVELDGYVIPKNALVNFMVADMGWDPDVWEDPMEFKPERFCKEEASDFDVTGSKEIKMMPFGAGRRVCPGSTLALLHLEYFVANLIWYFQWRPLEGEEIDLSEKQEFTTVMKNPLRARISPRIN
uniref:Cytochrome P450 n=1 Tax=Scoparia dulcis TaxID=107240 RepID=A0A1W7HBT9_SCODU